MKITLTDIFNMPSAVIYEPDKFKAVNSVFIDSRKCKKNSLFIAIKGENFDGHNFVKDAIKNGATAVVINNKKLDLYDDVKTPIIAVDNTIKAFGYLANVWRNKLKAKVISITGSNGKTTTKEILTTLLSSSFKVVSSEKNFNNHLGVPLTIFRANAGDDFLILEHGTNHFGEIKYTAELAAPNFALITNIGESHLEYFGDRFGVLKEKLELFNEAQKQKGLLFFNYNDPLLRKASKNFKRTYSFGTKGKPDLLAKVIEYDKEARPIVNISYGRMNLNVKLNLLGEKNIENFAAAVLIALKLGMKKKEIQIASGNIKPAKGRLNLIRLKESLVIDDTYNANPSSVIAALRVLRRIKIFPNKLLILGDMLELGKDAEKFHSHIAEQLKKERKIQVITIGRQSKIISRMLNNSRHFRRRIDLKNYLLKSSLVNFTILIKGSRGMKMEEFVETIMAK